MKRGNNESGTGSSTDPHFSSNSGSNAEMKMQEEEGKEDDAMDELIAALGYTVRSSDMEQVAHKLEQLGQVMYQVPQEDLNHIGSETVHHNPSDLCSWLDNLISELDPHLGLEPVTGSSSSFMDQTQEWREEDQKNGFDRFSDYNLEAIPGRAILGGTEPKRLKQDPCLDPTPSCSRTLGFPSEQMTQPVVVDDSQENGVRLVRLLLACAESVQENNLNLAEALLKETSLLITSQAGPIRKVATYFSEALARRIYGGGIYEKSHVDHSFSYILQMHFYETCPYLKFAHFTANQAILDACEGKAHVHVIDLSINQGVQWPALIQALALRPGGAPSVRLTGVGPPNQDDNIQQVGWRLTRLAQSINVKFEYRGLTMGSLEDIDLTVLEPHLDTVGCLAINSVFELHTLLCNPVAVDKFLAMAKQMNPHVFTIVEQEANHNAPDFLTRFTESLHYYSTMFDSLEESAGSSDKVMTDMYLGKQICNVVACEGQDRVERHEKLSQWRARLAASGFGPIHLGSNAYKLSSMLLDLFGGGSGYKVEESGGCLMLAWHNRPLIFASAWRCLSTQGGLV